MRRFVRTLAALAALTIAACVTINIYFPAEEIRGAADQIVNEVWGEKVDKPQEKPAPAAPKNPDSSWLQLLRPATAHANQDINVSTPEIRALKEAIKQRAGALIPYLDGGQVGIGADGLLKLRSSEGLDLKGRGEVNRLLAAENADRQRLYQEIARANGFPDKVGEVQEIFADSWRDQAAHGWYLEEKDGRWKKR
jgi:uncharacterized protein